MPLPSQETRTMSSATERVSAASRSSSRIRSVIPVERQPSSPTTSSPTT